jgi:protein TonB
VDGGVVGATAAGLPEPPPPPPPPRREASPIRPTTLATQPPKIKDMPPVYPPAAQAAGISGTVVIEVVVGADGRVTDARVVRSIPLLDRAALEAVRQWVYVAPLVDGAPVPFIVTVSVAFRLQ